jgi:PAS domain S-box-containing protein
MSYKILLIEDNILDVNTFGLMLRRSGLETGELLTAPSLMEGLAISENQRPDIIFLDISLTDSDGISTFVEVKRHFPKIPVVIITGNDNEALAHEALRLGAQDYLVKSKLSPVLIARALIYAIERKKFEGELQQSKARYESLVENTKDGIWSIDTQYRFTTLNSRFADSLMQYSGKRPVPGDLMLDFFPLSMHPFFEEVIGRAMTGERFRTETSLEFPSQVHYIELSVNPIKQSDKVIEGVSFFARNINQRKESEERIRKSEEAYRLLLETINDGVMFIDNDNVIQFANRKFLESTGYGKNEISGMDFSNLIAGNDPAQNLNIVSEILKHEDNREMKFIHKSGNLIWFSVKGTPLMNEKGEVAGTLLTHTEITDRKKAEQTIRRKEQDYSNLLETMNEGMVFIGRDENVRFANRKFESISGFSVSSLKGNPLPKNLLPVSVTELINETGDEPHHQYEFQVTTTKEEPVWCHINCSRITDEQGQVNGLLITYSDISVRKKAEARLQVTQRELNTFIYRSSHDLKGPLSSILGLINIFIKEEASVTHNPCVKMIKQSAEKLDRMLNEMLHVVRIRKEKIFPEPIDFYSQINEVIVGLRSNESFYDVQRKISIDSKKTLHTDKKLLSLVLHNLMDNAIRYRRPVDDSYVSVKIDDHMHGVMIRVEDNGIGFTDDIRNNIFNMFNKGNYNSEGSGLGLYVVKNAVDRLGGFVELTTDETNRTVFSLFLPDLYANSQLVIQEAEYS